MKRKVKITLPKAVEGMNVTGKINNRDGSISAYGAFDPYDSQNVPSIQVNKTLKPTTRAGANLEAEKGEVAITDLTQIGIPQTFMIGGERHYNGGTPLNLPPDSFIFSRDRKMKIKDPDILAQFGKTGKKAKSGYTYADLSKQYNNNEYLKKLFDDPDHISRRTAELMIENNNYKNGALALLQESQKGFPNGIPAISMPYIAKTGFDPATIFPQGGQGQPQQMKYGGQNYFAPGGELNKVEVTADTSPYTKEMFANVSTPQQVLDLLKGQRFASGDIPTAEQRLKMVDAIPVDQQYFDAVKKYTGMEFKHSSDDQVSTWEFQGYEPQQTKPKLSDKPFTPGFKYEDGKLYQKRQGRVTGEEHWQASNPLMASMYAKKYGTGEMSRSDLQKQVQENPEAFASTWGQQAEDDAQLAAITLKKFGGDMPKYQYQGEVLPNEQDYTSLYDANVYAEELPEFDQYSTMYDAMYGQPRQRVRINMPFQGYGVEAQTSNTPTRYQDIPKGKDVRKWDMTAEGYDEASVKPGDYIKKADGKWYKAEMVDIKTTPYEGELDERLGNLGEAYGRLEQRIKENPKLQDALYKKYKENMAKATTRNNLSEVDLEKARKMSKKEVIDNFLRAQRQIMAVQSKGPIEDKADVWDKNLDIYKKTISELGFDPMDAAETAAFQGAYISMQNLADTDPEFRKELNDFVISEKTRLGKADEKGGGTGKATISDIDGWFGNTTIGQSLLYAPKEKELKMKEAAWKEAKKNPAVKHIANTYKAQKTPFWTEDIINLGFAAKGLFDIRKEQPWVGMPGVKLPRGTFLTPTQQIQNILGAQQRGIQGAAAFGDPQAFVANTAALQANAMQQVANAIGTVQDKNVQIANQFELQRANIMNRANVRKAQLSTELYDRHKILNQQYRNAKNQAWDNIRRNMVSAWTNRGMTQTMNELYDQYNVDPLTGFTTMGPDRDLVPKDISNKDIATAANDLMSSVPGLTADKAMEYAAKSLGYSPTKGTGVDPKQFGYPGGMPYGYFPQG